MVALAKLRALSGQAITEPFSRSPDVDGQPVYVRADIVPHWLAAETAPEFEDVLVSKCPAW